MGGVGNGGRFQQPPPLGLARTSKVQLQPSSNSWRGRNGTVVRTCTMHGRFTQDVTYSHLVPDSSITCTLGLHPLTNEHLMWLLVCELNTWVIYVLYCTCVNDIPSNSRGGSWGQGEILFIMVRQQLCQLANTKKHTHSLEEEEEVRLYSNLHNIWTIVISWLGAYSLCSLCLSTRKSLGEVNPSEWGTRGREEDGWVHQ